jgi:hypothetical protein
MDLHLQEIGRYRNFVELKALDYAMLYDTLLEDEAKLTPELVEIYEQRFNYWNREPKAILQDILDHYDALDITAEEDRDDYVAPSDLDESVDLSVAV